MLHACNWIHAFSLGFYRSDPGTRGYILHSKCSKYKSLSQEIPKREILLPLRSQIQRGLDTTTQVREVPVEGSDGYDGPRPTAWRRAGTWAWK